MSAFAAVDNVLYDRLGVSRQAKLEEIKRQYRKLAVEWHPDKKGEDGKEKFQDIVEAYEILLNPDKRALYDTLGLEEYKKNGTRSDSQNMAQNIFQRAFANGGNFQFHFTHMPNVRPRTADIQVNMYIPLQDFMLGRTIGIQLYTERICKDCQGKGTEGGKEPSVCGECKGAKILPRRVGPLLLHITCPTCGGRGQSVAAADQCKSCGGKRVTKQGRNVKIPILPGALVGTRMEFKEHANEWPDHETGNLIAILQDADPNNPEHDKQQSLKEEDAKEEDEIKQARADYTEISQLLEQRPFRRQSPTLANLELVKPITLEECLLGAHFSIVTLDGAKLSLKTPSLTVIQTSSDKMVVPGWGLPKEPMTSPLTSLTSLSARGDIIIHFELQLPIGPISKDPKTHKLLRKALRQVFCETLGAKSKRVEGEIETKTQWIRYGDQFVKQ